MNKLMYAYHPHLISDSGPFDNTQGKQAFRQKDLQSEARMTERQAVE